MNSDVNGLVIFKMDGFKSAQFELCRNPVISLPVGGGITLLEEGLATAFVQWKKISRISAVSTCMVKSYCKN